MKLPHLYLPQSFLIFNSLSSKKIFVKQYPIWLLVCIIALSCKRKDVDVNQVKGEIVWESVYASGSLSTFIITTDGGYLLGGVSSSPKSGEKSEPNFGEDDYFVIKTDGKGKKLWDRTFGGTGPETLTCLIETKDGGYLIGGYSMSGTSGNKTVGREPWRAYDWWIIKVNSLGKTQWEKGFGGGRDDVLKEILPVKEGGYLLVGYGSNPETGVTNGLEDFWVVKIDEQGKKVWDKSYGGTNDDRGISAIATPDNCFLIGGNSKSNISGNKSANSKGESDYWLIKITGDGTLLWDRTYGGLFSDLIAGIATANNGGYLLSGFTFSSMTGNVPASNGFVDYWIVRVDDEGKLIWNKTIGDVDYDQTETQPVAYGNGFLLGGYQYHYRTTGLPVHNYSLTNIDASGNIVWNKPLQGNTLKKIAPSHEKGGYLIAGTGKLLNGGSETNGLWIALIK